MEGDEPQYWKLSVLDQFNALWEGRRCDACRLRAEGFATALRTVFAAAIGVSIYGAVVVAASGEGGPLILLGFQHSFLVGTAIVAVGIAVAWLGLVPERRPAVTHRDVRSAVDATRS